MYSVFKTCVRPSVTCGNPAAPNLTQNGYKCKQYQILTKVCGNQRRTGTKAVKIPHPRSCHKTKLSQFLKSCENRQLSEHSGANDHIKIVPKLF